MTWSTQKNLKEYLTKNLTIIANARIRILPTGTEHVSINLGFRVNLMVECEDGVKRNRPMCHHIASLGYNIAWAKAVLDHRQHYGITEGISPDTPPPKDLVANLLKEKAADNGIKLDPLKVASMMR